MNYYNYQDVMIIITGLQYIISAIALVLTIIARGFIFSKAKEPAWATVVPFYNIHEIFKIAGKKKLFPAYLVLYILYIPVFIAYLTQTKRLERRYNMLSMGGLVSVLQGMLILIILLLVIAVVMLVIKILMLSALSKSFGKGAGFTCGLIFLPVIFYCIIAFSNNIVYIGPNGEPSYHQMPPQNMGYGNQMPPQGMNYVNQIPSQNMNYGEQVPPPPYMGAQIHHQNDNMQVNDMNSSMTNQDDIYKK